MRSVASGCDVWVRRRARPISNTYGRTIGGIVVCCVIAACGRADDGDGRWRGSVDTLASGALHVLNPETGAWSDGEGWRLVEDLRIGSVEGPEPYAFGSLLSLSLAVDDDDRMYVLDGQSHEVRVFDADGVHVLSFGRSGSGPGEMRSPWLAGWSPDGNLWIADAANARYTAYSAAGEFVTSVPREISFAMSPWPGTIDGNGRILDVGIQVGERSGRALVRVDPRRAIADTFPLPQYDGGQFLLLNAAGRPMRSASIPFAGQLVWRLDPRGFVWSAITDHYRIVQQNLAGDTLLVIERTQRPIPVSAAERAEALDELRDFVDAGGRVDASRVPSTRPPLYDFAVDDRGYLWVAHSRDDGNDRITYDVFDPAGRYLGEVPTPARLSMWTARPVFTDDHVYGFTRGDMDVPYLVRLRIEGRH